jgi:hypothetical protein
MNPLFGHNRESLPYYPNEIVCNFYRNVIVPKLGYDLKEDEVSCNACVEGKDGKRFDYPNRNLLLKDLVDENGDLYHIRPVGQWDYIGNASPKERGSNDVCPICHEEACDYRLTSCPHRGHKNCFIEYKQLTEEDWKCPLCKGPFSPADRREFGLPQLRWV